MERLRDSNFKFDDSLKTIEYSKTQSSTVVFPSKKLLWDSKDNLNEFPFDDFEFEYVTSLLKGRYSLLLECGALVQFLYDFDGRSALSKMKASFYSCPFETEDLFNDSGVREYVSSKNKRISLRIEYDPISAKPIVHPATHLTLNGFREFRVPVSRPPDVKSFASFIEHHILGLSNVDHACSVKFGNIAMMTSDELEKCISILVP